MLKATLRKGPLTVAEAEDYVPFVDGLRGIAILMVVLGHLGMYCGRYAATPWRFPALERLSELGARGVQLFFIVSAFTLFNAARRRYVAGRFDVTDFYIRRVTRILPLCVVATTILLLPGGVLWTSDGIQRWLASVTFVFGFFRWVPGLEVVPGGWSLFVEESFYVLMPIVWAAAAGVFRSGRFLLVTLMVSWMWQALGPGLPHGAVHNLVLWFPFAQWFCFAEGILLFWLLRNASVISALKAPSCAFTVDLAAGVTGILFLRSQDIVVASIALVGLFVAASTAGSTIQWLTTRPLLRRFGVYCYSIYLLHLPLFDGIEPVRRRLMGSLGLDSAWAEVAVLIWLPLALSSCFVLGAVSFRWLERPFIDYGRAVARRRKDRMEMRVKEDANGLRQG